MLLLDVVAAVLLSFMLQSYPFYSCQQQQLAHKAGASAWFNVL